MGIKTVIAGLLGTLGLAACGAQATSYQTVDVAALKSAQQAGAYVLDVRTAGEYAAGHIADSHLIPLQELQSRMNEVPNDHAIYVICRSGTRSAQASKILTEAGKEAINVAGGMNAWTGAGYDITRP